MKDEILKEGKVYSILIEEIDFGINPKKFNSKSEEHIEEITRLAGLIKEYGQLQPIDITPFYRKDDGTVIVGETFKFISRYICNLGNYAV